MSVTGRKFHHFDTSAYPAEARPLFNRFVDIAPWPFWEKRFETFQAWCKANPLIFEFIAERYPLEIQMMMIRDRLRKSDELPSPTEDALSYRLFSFIAMVARVHQRLGPAGRKRLEGSLVDGLKDDKGLMPLAFEMSLAARLMRVGYGVFFHDLETGGGFDFLADRDGAALEVECKHLSGDIGRQIHRKRLFEFGGRIYDILSARAERMRDGTLVRLTLPGRLTGAHAQITALKDRLAACLASGSRFEESELCVIEITDFMIGGTPFDLAGNRNLNQDEVRQFVESRLGVANLNVLVVGKRSGGVVVIVVESLKSDRVLNSILRQLKDSSRDQLTGKYPGMLCAHLSEVTSPQLQNLAQSEASDPRKTTELHRASSDLLNGRPNVLFLIFSAFGEVGRKQILTDQGVSTVFTETGASYTFRNDQHPQYVDSRYVSV